MPGILLRISSMQGMHFNSLDYLPSSTLFKHFGACIYFNCGTARSQLGYLPKFKPTFLIWWSEGHKQCWESGSHFRQLQCKGQRMLLCHAVPRITQPHWRSRAFRAIPCHLRPFDAGDQTNWGNRVRRMTTVFRNVLTVISKVANHTENPTSIQVSADQFIYVRKCHNFWKA